MGASESQGRPSFVTFESWNQSTDYYVQHIRKYIYKDESKAPSVVPHADARYRKVESLILTISREFDATPKAVLLESPLPEAFVMWNPEKFEKPVQVIMTTGILNLSDAAIQGILAHEFTHLFLQWYDSNLERQPSKKYYLDNPRETNSELQTNVGIWKYLSAEVGPFSDSRLGGFATSEDGISFPTVLGHLLYRIRIGDSKFIQRVALEPWEITREKYLKCRELENTILDTLTYSLKAKSATTNRLAFQFETGEIQLRQQISKFESTMNACLKDLRVNYPALLKAAHGISDELFVRVEPLMNQEIWQTILSEMNSQDFPSAFLAMNRKLRAQMREIEKTFELDKVRTYDWENHADDQAVAVLHKLGIPVDDYIEFISPRSKCVQSSSEREPLIFQAQNGINCSRGQRLSGK